MGKKVSQKELVYLYCVTNRLPKLKEATGLADELHFVSQDGLYAVVSNVSEDEFSEENLKKNLADLEWIKIKAKTHEKIIEGVMKNSCVVPFKFGVLFKSEDNLRSVLKQNYQILKEYLDNLKDKEEWGVKVYCDMERLKANIINQENEILKIEEEINSSSSGKAYLLKKKKEELVKDTVEKRINEYGREIFKILNGLSLDTRVNKLLPEEVTERKEEMILNAAFLVEKNKVTEFVGEVNKLKVKYSDKCINLDCTGPWPPYNFCSYPQANILTKREI
jgi:hypothetical protein